MNDNQGIKAVMKALEEKAAKDELLMKVLKDIDHLLVGELEEENNRENSRLNLPYSSDPPAIDAAWN